METGQASTYTAAIDTFGKKQGRQNDWYALYAEMLDPFIQVKRAALHKYKDSPTAQSQEAPKVSKANVHQMLLHSDCLRYRQCQGNVRSHQKRYRPKQKEIGTTKVHLWRSHLRQDQANE